MPGLRTEPVDEGGILGVLVVQQLHRQRAGVPLVDRLPDLTHATLGQPPAQPVAAGEAAVGGGQDHGCRVTAGTRTKPGC
jgi:hypothetical protein